MNDDDKRTKMKEMGLAPHIIEKAIRQSNEDETYANEVYRYIKEIMNVEEEQVSHTLFLAFLKAVRKDLTECNVTQIALIHLSIILGNFHNSMDALARELLEGKEDKEK